MLTARDLDHQLRRLLTQELLAGQAWEPDRLIFLTAMAPCEAPRRKATWAFRRSYKVEKCFRLGDIVKAPLNAISLGSIQRRPQECVDRIVDRRGDAQFTTKADDCPVESLQLEGIPIRDITLH